jgi:hypothetical protein
MSALAEIVFCGADVFRDFGADIHAAAKIHGELAYDEPGIESGPFVGRRVISANEARTPRGKDDRALGEGASMLPTMSIDRFHLFIAHSIPTHNSAYPAGYVCQHPPKSTEQEQGMSACMFSCDSFATGKPTQLSRLHI